MEFVSNFTRELGGAKAFHSKRILLLEDQPQWQMIIGKTLRSVDNDISLRCARSVAQAEQLLYNNPEYDLIIADHFVDGSSTGLEFWKQCRRLYPSIPFVMVSGLTNEEFLDLVDKESNYPIFVSKALKKDAFKDAIEANIHKPPKHTSDWLNGNLSIAEKLTLGVFLATSLTWIIAFFQLQPTLDVNTTESQVIELVDPEATIASVPKVEKFVPENVATRVKRERIQKNGSSIKIRVDDIFTPEVRKKMEEVLIRADEIIALGRATANDIEKSTPIHR